jgi:hypothetical protein
MSMRLKILKFYVRIKYYELIVDFFNFKIIPFHIKCGSILEGVNFPVPFMTTFVFFTVLDIRYLILSVLS